jgi:hypothetical protein
VVLSPEQERGAPERRRWRWMQVGRRCRSRREEDRGGRREKTEEEDAGPTTVGMQQGERIPGMHTLGAGRSKCRSVYSSCWRRYSVISFFTLSMQIHMQTLLESKGKYIGVV